MARPLTVGERRQLVARRIHDRRIQLGLHPSKNLREGSSNGDTPTDPELTGPERSAGLTAAALPELAAALECTTTFLVGLTDDPMKWSPDEP